MRPGTGGAKQARRALLGDEMSALEEMFALHVRADGLPAPEREYRFHPERRWRFDFAWPDRKLAVEIEGGQWVLGRHQRPDGFEKDCEKYNAAALAGWRVLRFTGRQVKSLEALRVVGEALNA